MKNADKPREFPATEEGKEAFDRFRELTRRLVNVPKEKIANLDRERKEGS